MHRTELLVVCMILAAIVVGCEEKSEPAVQQQSLSQYDSIGIVCVPGEGADGQHVGMIMSQVGTEADGDYPVALTGRVYCWVDTSNGPVKPGDLLTTSVTPGHAARVVDYDKARGAVIGKALSGLQDGRGLVLILVSLQ